MKLILKNEIFKRFATGIVLGFCFFGAYFHSLLLFNFILFALLLIILFFEWPQLIGLNIKSKKYWYVSLIYPIIPMSTLLYINSVYRNKDFILPLYPFLIAWVADTGAYFLGKIIGKNKICPNISPGKSWQGLLGAFISVAIFNIFILPGIKTVPFALYLHSIIPILLFSFLITIVAFLGDIFISLLKRKEDLKDTGNLLPGHGGLLDRFDSVLFVSTLIFAILLVSKIISYL